MKKFRMLILLFGILTILGINRVLKATPVEYTLNFNVEVPEGTEGNVFVVGEFTNWLNEPIGPLQPIQLTKGAGNVYSGSALYVTDKTGDVQYKYINAKDLASINWDYGEIYGGNRSFSLDNPTININDTVSAWGDGGYKYPLTIKYFVDGVEEDMQIPTAEMGDTLTITKNEAIAGDFAFWKINGAVRTDIKTETFTIRTQMEMHIEAHYVSNTKLAVVFMDSNLKVLKEEFIDKVGGTNPVAPTAPTKTMLNCVGWALIDDYETIIPTLPIPTENTFYVAKYELKTAYNKTRNVTVDDGLPEAKDVGSVVTVTTTKANFSYWIDDNTGAILSHQRTYKFTLLDENIHLRAICGQGDKSTEPMVSIRRYFNLDLEEGFDTFIGQFDSLDPNLYDIVQFGFVYGDSPENFTKMHFVKSYNPETNEFMVTVPDNTGEFTDNDYKMRAVLMYYRKEEGIPDSERFKVIMNLSHYEFIHEVNPPSNNPVDTEVFYMVTSRNNWDPERAIPVTKHKTYHNKYYSREIIVTYPGYQLQYEYKFLHSKNWASVENKETNRLLSAVTLKNIKEVQKAYTETPLDWKALDGYRVYLYDKSLENHFFNKTKEVELYYWNIGSNTYIQTPNTYNDRPTFLRDEENGYWYYDIPLTEVVLDKSTMPNFGLKLNEKYNPGVMYHEFASFDVTKPYMSTERWVNDGGLNIAFDIVQLDFVESLEYKSGFEEADGFTLGNTYYSTVRYHNGTEGKWGIYYGNIDSDNKITGNQSLQLRYDPTKPNSCGYAFTDFEMSRVNKVTFKAQKVGGDVTLTVYLSNDGGLTWIADANDIFILTAELYTYTVKEAYRNDKIKIKFEITYDVAPTTLTKVIIDEVKIYSNIPNTFEHQVDVQLAGLVVPEIVTVAEDIPTTTPDGLPIYQLGSNKTEYIDPHPPYTVTRPEAGMSAQEVILNFDVKRGEVIKSREFSVLVPPLE